MRSSSQTESRVRPGAAPLLVTVLALRPRDWMDLAVAIVELGIARVRIATADRRSLLQPRTTVSNRGANSFGRVERVRVAIARASHRLPWRADCLVQALAARHWLGRLGVETSLRIGVPGKRRDQFEAHTWLMHGEIVITGGDIDDYVALGSSTSSIELDRSPPR